MDETSPGFEQIVRFHMAWKRARLLRDHLVSTRPEGKEQLAGRLATASLVLHIERCIMDAHEKYPELRPTPPFEGEALDFLGTPATLIVYEVVRREWLREGAQLDTSGDFFAGVFPLVRQIIRLKDELKEGYTEADKWLVLLLQELSRIPKPLLKLLQ